MTTVFAAGIGAAIAAYGGLISYLWLFQRRFLFRADRARPDPAVCGVPEMRTLSVAAFAYELAHAPCRLHQIELKP